MHCFRILSIFVALFLFIALACSLVGIWSISWWTGDFEAVLPGTNDTVVPQNTTMHWLFAVRYGLTKACWWTKHARLSSDPDDYEIVPPTHKCTPHSMNFRNINSDTSEIKSHDFRNILICLAVGIIFNVVAFAFAFFNLPCIRRMKKCFMFMTIILTAVSAIAVLVGLFIASNQLYIDAVFMREMRKSAPVFEEFENISGVDVLLKEVWGKLDDGLKKYEGMKVIFEKGYSFVVACVAEAFLLLALLLAIVENCCFQRTPEREYLVDEKKPSKL